MKSMLRVHHVMRLARRTPMLVRRNAFATHALYRNAEAAAKEEPVGEKKVYQKTDAETHEFKTETRKLLDIVANSLYTEKEVSLPLLLDKNRKIRIDRAEGRYRSFVES